MALTEPNYLLQAPTSAFLSDTRAIRLSPSALSALNFLLDELLQNFIHAALAPAPDPPHSGYLASINPSVLSGPLTNNEVFTTERLKAAVIRTVGPRLGQIAVLEGGVAIHELLSLSAPSLRGHPALKLVSGGGTGVGQSAEEVFRSLRSWVLAISKLGAACPPSGRPGTLTEHLVALTPPKAAPSPTSPHLSFVLALYAERSLMAIAERILERVGRVVERRSDTETGGILEVEAALMEDDLVFVWYSEMRVRARIEAEVAQIKARASGASSPAGNSPLGRMGSQKGRSGAVGRTSNDSSSFKGSREGSMGLGITAETELLSSGFEELIQSGKTMKFSLTPDRLRTMEKLDRTHSLYSPNPALRVVPEPPGIIPLPPIPSSTSPVRRLKPRGPAVGLNIDEDDDEDDDDPTLPRSRTRPKESLLDILNSPPPGWVETTKTPTPLLSIPGTTGSPSPASVGMAITPSQDSVQSSSSGGFSDSSEAFDAWANASSATRKRTLKPKDERKDLAFERQINSDLVDFFQHSPPPSSHPPLPPSVEDKYAPQSPKQARKGGLRGMFSRGSKTKEDERPGSPVTTEDSRTPSNSRTPAARGSTRSLGTSSSVDFGTFKDEPPSPTATRSLSKTTSVPADKFIASQNAKGSEKAALAQRLEQAYPTVIPSTPTPPNELAGLEPKTLPPTVPVSGPTRATLPPPPSIVRKTGSSRSIVSDAGLPSAAVGFITATEGRRSSSPPTPDEPKPRLPAAIPIPKRSGVVVAPVTVSSTSVQPAPTPIRRDSKDSLGRRPSLSKRIPVPMVTEPAIPPRASSNGIASSASVASSSTRRPSITAVTAARESEDSTTSALPLHVATDTGTSNESSTLRELKDRMAKMQTVQECLLLLEEMMGHSKEDSGFASATPTPSATKFDTSVVEENSLEAAQEAQQEYDEQAEARLVEFFLGIGDDPVFDVGTVELLAEETPPPPPHSNPELDSPAVKLDDEEIVDKSKNPSRPSSITLPGSFEPPALVATVVV